MLVTALANLINVVLAYALIYGHFGLPALGAVGSAWATFLARGWRWRCCWRRAVARPQRRAISGRGQLAARLGVAREVLRIGVPAALEQMLIIGAFVTLTLVVAGLGTVALAAHRMAFNALSLSFLPGIGFGIAATALVGQSVGARRLDEGAAATRIAMRWAVDLDGRARGLACCIFAPQIMRMFTDDPAVIAAGAAALRVVALAQPFWAVMFV